jgi:plasmid segregation protein ParM
MMLMMPIDMGNKAIKTEHFDFHSEISVLEDVPGEGEEAVRYQGRYYRLSPDKSVDERYYILTLFAIAKELGELKPPRLFLPGEVLKIDLVVGLPPLYYRGSIRSSGNIFTGAGKPWSLNIWGCPTGFPLQGYMSTCRPTRPICMWRGI